MQTQSYYETIKTISGFSEPPSAQEQWRSQMVTSPQSGHLQFPYCSCWGPHLQRGWLSEGTQIRLYSAYSCRCTWVPPWCTIKCYESKYLVIMFFSTNQKMFIIWFVNSNFAFFSTPVAFRVFIVFFISVNIDLLIPKFRVTQNMPITLITKQINYCIHIDWKYNTQWD